MIKITLLDKSVKEFNQPISPLQVAEDISPNLAKAVLFARVNGEEFDATRLIETDSNLELVTTKNEEAVLPVVRHDLAHVLAEAVTELYPNVKLATGPATENGFFYDFLSEHNFSTEDLSNIEKRMHQIIERNEEVTREVWSLQQAEDFFSKNGEILKLEIIKDLPKDETITVYKQGNFLDLCRGPHLSSTGRLKPAFKLVKVSGAYWKGDSNNHSLQRIYGIAFLKDKDLKAYENLKKEAEARDHRKLGPSLGLFHQQDEAVGSVFWHPKGWSLYLTIENYIRTKLKHCGYQEIKTPQILNRNLWEKSGHWEKFKDDIFIIKNDDVKNSENQDSCHHHHHEELAVKPMSCPAHVEVFKQGIKSYKDLPIRTSEFGSCFRNEPSGALHGIMRVRAFTQDDAHIFCTKDQVLNEVTQFNALLKEVYTDLLGEVSIIVKFSDRPEKRAGSDETWDFTEKLLLDAAKNANLDVILNKGEGAFYGPKLEYTLKDSLGRMWQCGTLQLDCVLPERLNAKYIGEDGKEHTPIMIHRAILGSFERFIGIMIEHYAGRFPFWLAPVQVVVATITNDCDEYANKVVQELKSNNIRVDIDTRNEKINYKIREHSVNKIPVLIIIGKKEIESNQLVLRILGQEKQEVFDFNEGINYIIKQDR